MLPILEFIFRSPGHFFGTFLILVTLCVTLTEVVRAVCRTPYVTNVINRNDDEIGDQE